MKIGIETESCHLLFQNKKMDIFDFIERAAAYGYDGVMINLIEKKNLLGGWGALGSKDMFHLQRVKQCLQKHHLFVELDTRGTSYSHLRSVLELADFFGADVVRTFVMSGPAYTYQNLGGTYEANSLQEAVVDLKQVIPLLKKYRIRLAIENHELETIEELIKLLSQVESPWVGLTFDVGNTINAWEDPVTACQKAAPYTFAVHLKDAEVFQYNAAYYVRGTSLGKGNIDLKSICNILYEKSTLTRCIVELCHPYASSFKRPKGTGGVSQLGKGAFSIGKPLFTSRDIKPEQYYTYDGERLPELMDMQLHNFETAASFFKNIFHECEAKYSYENRGDIND